MRFTNAKSGTHTGESREAHADGTPVAAGAAAAGSLGDDAAAGEPSAEVADPATAAGGAALEAPHADTITDDPTRTRTRALSCTVREYTRIPGRLTAS
jgi:hypothetical protein